MAIGRMKPKQFKDAGAFSQVAQASQAQTGKKVTEKSIDPINFPVFETPVNRKVLIYVPNHRTEDELGIRLRMDKGAFHQVIAQGGYHSVRCLSGIILEEENYDGTCPLCDVLPECWDLYHKQYEETAKMKGIDVNNDPEDSLKAVRQDLTKKMVVKGAEVWYTFPIVEIDCEEGKTVPKKNAEGQLSGKVVWYSIREQTYKEKWEKAFEAMEEECAAGAWFVLNFTYESKSGQHDKMGSARALQVVYKPMGETYASWATYYDQLTEGWTPQKATETVIANFFLEMEEVQEVTDVAMQPVRDKLAMLNMVAGGIGVPQSAPIVGTSSPEAIASQFGAVPVESLPAGGAPPQVGVSTEAIPQTGVSTEAPPQRGIQM